MNGRVDESLRALVDLTIRRTEADSPTIVAAWVDTAFDGFLVFPHEKISNMGLQQEAATEAILADGTRVTLESYACCVEWFGEIKRAR